MKVIIIGTDHRLQASVVKDETGAWVPRRGGDRYRKLLEFCVNKLGATVILEETHPNQDRIEPTIASVFAKNKGIGWETIGLGEPTLSDALIDPPLEEAFRMRVVPVMLAGVYDMAVHKTRESSMYSTISAFVAQHECVLVVVGYTHLAVLAKMIEAQGIPVSALLFTYPLVVDETKS